MTITPAPSGISGFIYAKSALMSMTGDAALKASLVVGTLSLSSNVRLTQMAVGAGGVGDVSGSATRFSPATWTCTSAIRAATSHRTSEPASRTL